MSFIGNAPAAIPTSFQAVQADSFNGNGSTTNFTLSRQITNLYDIEVLVDNVQQSPYDGSYSVNGTTITFSSAPGSGTNNIYIVYRDHPITSIQPKGDLTLEANLNVDGTVYANATLARDGGSDATINGVTPTSDNLMGRNRIINGAMEISQRGTSFAGLTNGSNGYTLDRWFWNESGTSTAVQTVAQSTSVPSNGGFTQSLQVTTTTAHSPLAADNTYRVGQSIEGFNVADLMYGTANAKTITLSFWVRSSLTGTFGGVLFNGAFDRFYVYSYTINATDTWEYKTVTIAGDTTGTWATNNTTGLAVEFSMGAGSNYLTTSGSWGSTRVHAPTGQVNVAGTNGATWYITGVQLEAGSVATPFERRQYGHELALCQRYFQTLGGATFTRFFSGFIPATNESVYSFVFPVQMRAAPTGSASGTIAVYHGAFLLTTTTSVGFSDATSSSIACSGFVSSGLTTNGGALLLANNDAAARINFSAEL